MGSPVEGTSKHSASDKLRVASSAAGNDQVHKICGLPLKYVSLLTLAIQNTMLTIIMHYSRISTPPSRTYSAASAVLLNELLKGAISLAVALTRVDDTHLSHSRVEMSSSSRKGTQFVKSKWRSALNFRVVIRRFRLLGNEVFSRDCWKLSIPAILYVIQNNLQYVAASNLQAATFQVTYQMKILTTAAFSVILLRKRLDPTKWFALLALAIGVAIVQLQTSNTNSNVTSTTQTHVHDLHPIKGLLAVTAACFTSGLAGVYFEMVLKNSQADLWVRNVQLSLFSLLPALVPILFSPSTYSHTSTCQWNIFSPFSLRLFDNFGPWAWATVATQVFGGLVTAIVIKYSDNILKGFATSLSIVISSVASVALFDFKVQMEFLIGCSIVLGATWVYNRPSSSSGSTPLSRNFSDDEDVVCANSSLFFKRWQFLFPSSKKTSTSMSLLPSPVISSSRSSCSSDASSRPSSPNSITNRYSVSKLLPNSLSLSGLRSSSSNISGSSSSSTSARPLSLLTPRKNSYPSSPVIEYASSSSGSGSGSPDMNIDLEKDDVKEKEKEKKRFSYLIGANISSSALGAALRYSFPTVNIALASSSTRRKSEDNGIRDNCDQDVLTGRFEPIVRDSSLSSTSRHHHHHHHRSKSNDYLPLVSDETYASHLRSSSSSSSSRFLHPTAPSQFSQSSGFGPQLPSSIEVSA